jgi:hypothetical protein
MSTEVLVTEANPFSKNSHPVARADAIIAKLNDCVINVYDDTNQFGIVSQWELIGYSRRQVGDWKSYA